MNNDFSTPRSASAPPVTTGPLLAPRLCIAVQGETAVELLARAKAALAESSFLELRLDACAAPGEVVVALPGFFAAHPEATAIATCRRRLAGGNFAGMLIEELELLARAAEAGCGYVDLALESAEEAAATSDSTAVLAAWRTRLTAARCQLIVSAHDFAATGDLAAVERRIARFQPDLTKIVSTANALTDNLAVFDLLKRHTGAKAVAADMAGGSGKTRKIIAIAMGELGLISRILGPRMGSAFTFASSGAGVETAPGQITAERLRSLYRFESLTPATRLYAVAGDPIAHSLSPLMHNAAFAHCGLDAVMLPLKTASAEELFALIAALGIAGAAVTMPLKRELFAHLTECEPLATRIGACNTLRVGQLPLRGKAPEAVAVDKANVPSTPGSADSDTTPGDSRRSQNKIYGTNTDVAGVVEPLAERMELTGARIAILGAGGAARAAVFGLVDRGAQVAVVNRTVAHAVALAEEAGAEVLSMEEFARAGAAEPFDALINSTPCGMAGARAPLPIAPADLHARLVFDMVYNPLETPLLALARARGLATVSGVEMFVAQGVRQFELWTGLAAPRELMRQIVLDGLSRC